MYCLMKRFASHRIYMFHEGVLLKSYVVEVEALTGRVLRLYPFTDELSFTEWLGGLIVISHEKPDLSDIVVGDAISTCDGIITKKSASTEFSEDTLLYAFYICDFNVVAMSCSDSSRVIQLC